MALAWPGFSFRGMGQSCFYRTRDQPISRLRLPQVFTIPLLTIFYRCIGVTGVAGTPGNCPVAHWALATSLAIVIGPPCSMQSHRDHRHTSTMGPSAPNTCRRSYQNRNLFHNLLIRPLIRTVMFVLLCCGSFLHHCVSLSAGNLVRS